MRKLCKDCRYFSPSLDFQTEELKGKYAVCALTMLTGFDGTRCLDERDSWFGCGIDAKYFKEKQP